MPVQRFDQVNQFCLLGDQMIVVSEDHDRSFAGVEQSVASCRKSDVVFRLDDMIDHCRFSGAIGRESQFGFTIIEDVNRGAILGTMVMNAANEGGTALGTMDRFDAKSNLITHGQFGLRDNASNEIRVYEVPLSGTLIVRGGGGKRHSSRGRGE